MKLGLGIGLSKVKSGGGGSAYDPDAQLYFDRVFDETGTNLTDAQKIYYNANFFLALKNAVVGDLYTPLRRVHVTKFVTEAQARIDLTTGNKTIIPDGTPTYSAVTGYDTSFTIPRYTGISNTDAHEFWQKSNNTSGAGSDVQFSGQRDATNGILWFPGTTFPVFFSNNFNLSGANTSYDTLAGCTANASDQFVYTNGVQRGTVTQVDSVYLFDSVWKGTQLGCIFNCAGIFMTGAQVAEYTTIIQSFLAGTP